MTVDDKRQVAQVVLLYLQACRGDAQPARSISELARAVEGAGLWGETTGASARLKAMSRMLRVLRREGLCAQAGAPPRQQRPWGLTESGRDWERAQGLVEAIVWRQPVTDGRARHMARRQRAKGRSVEVRTQRTSGCVAGDRFTYQGRRYVCVGVTDYTTAWGQTKIFSNWESPCAVEGCEGIAHNRLPAIFPIYCRTGVRVHCEKHLLLRGRRKRKLAAQIPTEANP
jgi:hypothetical protein